MELPSFIVETRPSASLTAIYGKATPSHRAMNQAQAKSNSRSHLTPRGVSGLPGVLFCSQQEVAEAIRET